MVVVNQELMQMITYGKVKTGTDNLNNPDDWISCVTMKTLGSMVTATLTGLLFGITLALFISLPISPTNDNTSAGSTSGLSALLRERNGR